MSNVQVQPIIAGTDNFAVWWRNVYMSTVNMEVGKMVKVGDLFKRDQSGLMIPELNEGYGWALNAEGQQGTCLITIKVDGVPAKVTKRNGGTQIWKKGTAEMSQQANAAVWILCSKDRTEDMAYIEALENRTDAKEGQYVMYGPSVKGNPQRAKCHLMLCVSPVESYLIMYSNKSGIRRGSGATLQAFYDSIKDELSKSDCEGVVFQLEYPSMTTNAACQVTRRDLGMEWPLPDCPYMSTVTIGAKCTLWLNHPSAHVVSSPQEASKSTVLTSPIGSASNPLKSTGVPYKGQSCSLNWHSSCNTNNCECECHVSGYAWP